jgi:hypothetical protein
MTASGPTFDAEALTMAWAKALPGLIGGGGPLVALVLTDDARSSQKGVIASLRVVSSEVDMEGLGHSARIAFEFKAPNGDNGGRRQAYRAAKALLVEVRNLVGDPVLVSTVEETAKLAHAHTVQGPTWVGSPGGQATYRGDATFVWQKA